MSDYKIIRVCDDCFLGGEELTIGALSINKCARCGKEILPKECHTVRAGVGSIYLSHAYGSSVTE